MYSLTSEEIKGDYRPNYLMNRKLDKNFYTDPPLHDEGQLLPNRDVGISFVNRQLIIAKSKGEGTGN